MGRRSAWPPRIESRRGVDYVRVWRAGRRTTLTLGPTGSEVARLEYRRVVAEMEMHGRTLPPAASPDLTVLEICVAHQRWAEGYHCPDQQVRIRRSLRPAVALYGDTPAAAFGPLAYAACIRELVGAGLCRTYINALGWCLYGAFRWAASRQLIPPSVPQALLLVDSLRKGHTEAPERPRVRPAVLADVLATLPHLSPVVAAMVRLQLATGARPGEVCVLRPGDLDRDYLRVEGVAVWLYRLDEHKNDWRGLLRWIPVPPSGQEVLSPYLDRPADAYCFSPREVPRSPRGAALLYCSHAYRVAVVRACARAGVPEWGPNRLRHLVATEVETACGREDARCVLGHRSPTVTARYAESVERAARVLARMG